MVMMTFSSNATSSCNGSAEKCTDDIANNAEVWRTLMAVYLGAILFLSLAFNGTLCLMFYKKSHLLSVSNCFVLNLICCQLGMSVFVLPFSLFAVVSQDWIYTGRWCETQAFFFTTAIVAQQLALLNVSIDRNYAIMNSLRYPNVFTQTLCSILIGISWMFALFVSVPPLLNSGMGNYHFHHSQFLCGLNWAKDENFLVVFSLIAFALPVFIQSFCYIKIFFAAVGHSKRSSKVKPWTSRPSRGASELRSDSSTCSSDQSEEVVQNSVECKAVKTIFIIALAYSVCWVPYFIDSFLTLKGENVNPNFSAAAICCLFSSSLLNPMIYAYMNRVTRREIGRFVCGHSGVNDSDEAGSTSMSAYSAAWAQNRIRSKSNGAMTNEMDTIVEETEVEESVFCEPRSQLRLPVCKNKHETIIKSPSSNCSQHKEHVTIKTENCYTIDRAERLRTISGDQDIQLAIAGSSTSDIENEQSSDSNQQHMRESAWNILKSEKFNNELRRTSKSGESYFDKGKRRKKRDCGSFLYFENNMNQSEPRGYRKRDKEKKGTQRYSLDHVQNISIGKTPSVMKFRLSLNDSDLKTVNKLTVMSNFEIENKAHEDSSDIPGQISQTKLECLNPVRRSLSPHISLPIRDCEVGNKYRENKSFPFRSSSLPMSNTIIQENEMNQNRVHSAPASLFMTSRLDYGTPAPPCRESTTISEWK